MRKWVHATASVLMATAAMCIAVGAKAQTGAPTRIVMGFVPSRDVNEIQLSADKIGAYLSKRTGLNVVPITVQNYAAIVVGMNSAKIDLAFLGPLDYVVAHNKNGAYPLTASVRHGKKGYRGMVFVRKDSAIRGLAGLKGRTVALGDPLSASSNLYPKAAMRAAGVDPAMDIRTHTLSSASAIVVSVLQKKVDAGAVYVDARTNPEVLKRFPDAIKNTRVIHTTEIIPADPQIVRKDLDPALVQKLKDGLLALSDDAEGKVWLKELFGIDALEPATDADYDGLRQVLKASPSAVAMQ